MAMIHQRRVLGFKVETVPGTAESLTSAQAIFVIDGKVDPEITHTEREALGYLGQLPPVPGIYGAKVSGKVELVGGGSSNIEPAWASLIFPACGYHQSTHTYTPTSVLANYKTLTVGEYIQGDTGQWLCKTAAGCMGTFKLVCEVGKPVMVEFDLKGIWQGVTDVSAGIGEATFPPIPPRFASSTFTLGSYTPLISKFEYDAGASVEPIYTIANASGIQQFIVSDRKPKGKINPMGVNVATWNLWSDYLTPTTRAMSMTIGTGTGGTITLTAPSTQIINAPEGTDGKKVITDLELQFNESSGDDSFSIAFS